jgi:mono/diheme cytochrome c family protein
VKTGVLWPEPSLDPNPVAIVRGEAVMKARCWNCHEEIPLAPRVAGWTPEYAYDALGHLPELRPAMPPFKGTEQDRADLAIYLWSIGKDAQRPPDLGSGGGEEWAPPAFEAPDRASAPGPAAPAP